MSRELLDQTIARLELEKRVIDQSIAKLKALRDAPPRTPIAGGQP